MNNILDDFFFFGLSKISFLGFKPFLQQLKCPTFLLYAPLNLQYMCLCLNECAYIIFFSLFLVQNCQYHPNTHFNLFGLDPYLNTDAGTMSPFEHGEVFVLDDGGEVHREISSLFIYCCTLENISVFPFFFFSGGMYIFDHQVYFLPLSMHLLRFGSASWTFAFYFLYNNEKFKLKILEKR